MVALPAAADVIKQAKAEAKAEARAEAEMEAARAAPPPRRRDDSSTASSSLKGSPRRQRKLVGQRTTYADSAEVGLPISAEAEARRPSSAFRRISIRSPSGTTRGSLVALERQIVGGASWNRLGTPIAYPSEEPPPTPPALTPRAAALATALESLLLASRPGSADESAPARRAVQQQRVIG